MLLLAAALLAPLPSTDATAPHVLFRGSAAKPVTTFRIPGLASSVPVAHESVGSEEGSCKKEYEMCDPQDVPGNPKCCGDLTCQFGGGNYEEAVMSWQCAR